MVEETDRDIWGLYDAAPQTEGEEAPVICVLASVGWNSEGMGFFGPGVATEAAARWVDLRLFWGSICIKNRAATRASMLRDDAKGMRCLVLPYIGFWRRNPAHAWRCKPSLDVLEESLREARTMKHSGRILLPAPWVEERRFEERPTRRLVNEILGHDRRWLLVANDRVAEEKDRRRAELLEE